MVAELLNMPQDAPKNRIHESDLFCAAHAAAKDRIKILKLKSDNESQSAKIESQAEEIKSLRQDMKSLRQDMKSLGQDMKSLRQDMKSLKKGQEDLTKMVLEMQSQLSKMRGDDMIKKTE